MSGVVIFVDDETHVRLSSKQTLELAGFEVLDFDSAQPALTHLARDWSGILISDVRMPRMDGLSLLKYTQEIDPDLPVVLITGHGDIAMAVEAMRNGAYDFIEKPCAGEILVDVVKRAVEKRLLVLENRSLRSELEARQSASPLIGKSPAMERLRKTIGNLAEADADVLIFGETGAGKELVARCLHEHGPRAQQPFVAINCGAIPETIIESELFGHEQGAFTGAQQRRVGKFEYANGGTIFLDEIESMPLYLQVKLLRVLQERRIERLGSNQTIELNMRVLAATKADIKTLIEEDKFRADLFYRLNVVTVHIPPLRERLEDIPLLFHSFLLRACARYQRKLPTPSTEQIRALMLHDWPGNVRELQNAAERLVLGIADQDLDLSALTGEHTGSVSLTEHLDAYEKCLISQELSHQKGNINATYSALGIGRKTLYDKMRKHHLNGNDFR